jgi:hypothetical protein
LDADTLLKEFDEPQDYFRIVEARLNGDTIAYIDPTSQYGLDWLRQKLRELLPINPNQMAFHETHHELLSSNLHFGPSLRPLIVTMHSHFDSKRISDATLEQYDQPVQEGLTRQRRDVHILMAANRPVNADQALVIP